MNTRDQAERAAIAILQILALTDDPAEAERRIVARLHGELATARREGRREARSILRSNPPLKSQENSTGVSPVSPPVRFGERV